MKEKGNILQEIIKRITATLLLFFLNINGLMSIKRRS